MDWKLLEDIGLSEGEVKVYSALLKLGSSKTGKIAKLAGVSSSKVYKILDRLEKKGLAGHVLKGKVKHFVPTPPKRIMDYVEGKEKELGEKKVALGKMLPELERQAEAAKQKNEAALYEGFKAVSNFFRNIVDELKPGETYYVLGANYGEVEGLRQFFYSHHMRRNKKGIKVKMLANEEVKENIEETTKLNSEIRLLPRYMGTKMQTVFYKNKVFVAIWTKEPAGFLMESEEAAKSFRTYFEELWKIAKPLE